MSRINNDRRVAHFRLASGDLVELFGPVSTNEPYRRNVAVALGVEDVDKARTEMERAGVSFLTETNTWENESRGFFEAQRVSCSRSEPNDRRPEPHMASPTGEGVATHRDGGSDPTELGQPVQQEIHRPHRWAPPRNHRPQPV